MSGSSASSTASGLGAGVLVMVVGLGGWMLLGPDDPQAAYADLPPAAPERLLVPSLDIDADVVPVALSADAVLDPPQDGDLVGWWDGSARPGDRSGQTVITGHTVHTGGGAMDPIVDVEAGRVVDLRTDEGTMRYRVTHSEVVEREDLASRAEDIFGQDRTAGRLVLVTCTNWDGSVYEDNIVVYAKPLGSPAPDA